MVYENNNHSFFRQKNRLKLKWRVIKNEDIADPYVVVRSKIDPNNIVYETTLPYFKRSIDIDLTNTNKNGSLPATGKAEFQICLLAKDSKTFVKKFYQSQCRDLDNSLGSGSVLSKQTSLLLILLFTLSLL